MKEKMKNLTINDILSSGGRLASSSYISPEVLLELPVDIADNITIYGGVEIGKYSYLNVGGVIYSNVHIGRYCSIGRNVEIGLAQHPLKYLSSHPFQISNTLFKRDSEYTGIKTRNWTFHPKTTIGHDVWIGAKVCILSGVNISHGAIIAAGAVVTKDVPPYAIVGGIPAKIIKYRFEPDIIKELLALEWWTLTPKGMSEVEFDKIDSAIEKIKEIKGISYYETK